MDRHSASRGVRLSRMIALLVVTAAISGASIAAGRCDAVADFYRGRSISLVIGFGAGGGYDAYARLLTRHIGRHIPGNPSLVAQNMQGAGGLKATQFLYDVAPRDGTVIGTVARGQPLAPLLLGDTRAVPVEGIDLNPLDLPLHDIFFRFIHFKDFDVAELSMAKYVSMISQGDDSLIALPVFPSRVPRHSAIYVRRDGPVRQPADLAGPRV